MVIVPNDLIIKAKTKFGKKAIEIISKDLKIDKFDSKKGIGCCPFHPEDTPSFAYNKKENYFKCFGCGKTYGIIDHYLQFYKLSFIESVKKLFKDAEMVFDYKEEKKEIFKNYKYPKVEDIRDRTKVENYLKKRCINKETLDFADIKQSSEGNIVFEHRDLQGRLVCTKYRPAKKIIKKTEKMMFWQVGANTCPVLYGMDKTNTTVPLLIVEGHIDYLSCIEAGYNNVVSIPNGANDYSWIEFNWDYLEQFENILLFFDNDKPGEDLLKESIVRLGEHKCKVVQPDKDIEDKVFDYFYSNYEMEIRKTDANNILVACGKQVLLNVINNAKDIPIPDVIKLMECESFDIDNAEIIPTGTKELDSYIYGYIEGTLNLWTGRTGAGKSSYLLISCIIEAINSGYSTFVFSGELTKSQCKNWTIQQLAGRQHTIEFDNGENKPKTYKVTSEAKKKIETFYNDMLYIYDSYLLTSPEKLISRMEYMRKKHGVKNFIVDNLMILSLDIQKHGSELNAQKDLIIQFLKFAIQYDSIIHLVCHSRKPNGFSEVDEYEVLGSSSIINLAHRIFSLRRTSKKEIRDGCPYDAYVTILKDRILGVSKKDIGLHYDSTCRRLRCDKDDKNRQYSWDDGTIKYDSFKFGDNGILVNHRKEIYE